MNHQLAKWAKKFVEEFQLVVDDHINIEARENMYSFSLSDEALSTLTLEDVSAFVLSCANAVQHLVSSEPYVFYSWYDEQASQLRVSAVGQRFERLPFGRQLSESELDIVAMHFLGRLDVPVEHPLPIWVKFLQPTARQKT